MEPKYTREKILETINNEIESMSPDQVVNWSVRLAVLNDTTGDEYASAAAEHAGNTKNALAVSGVGTKAEIEARSMEAYARMIKKEKEYESALEIINALKKKADIFRKQMAP